MDEARHILMMDLPNAFGAVNRELRRAIMYKKWIHAQLIGKIRMVRENTKLRPNVKGNIGKRQGNNKGVF